MAWKKWRLFPFFSEANQAMSSLSLHLAEEGRCLHCPFRARDDDDLLRHCLGAHLRPRLALTLGPRLSLHPCSLCPNTVLESREGLDAHFRAAHFPRLRLTRAVALAAGDNSGGGAAPAAAADKAKEPSWRSAFTPVAQAPAPAAQFAAPAPPPAPAAVVPVKAVVQVDPPPPLAPPPRLRNQRSGELIAARKPPEKMTIPPSVGKKPAAAVDIPARPPAPAAVDSPSAKSLDKYKGFVKGSSHSKSVLDKKRAPPPSVNEELFDATKKKKKRFSYAGYFVRQSKAVDTQQDSNGEEGNKSGGGEASQAEKVLSQEKFPSKNVAEDTAPVLVKATPEKKMEEKTASTLKSKMETKSKPSSSDSPSAMADLALSEGSTDEEDEETQKRKEEAMKKVGSSPKAKAAQEPVASEEEDTDEEEGANVPSTKETLKEMMDLEAAFEQAAAGLVDGDKK